jgi:hypothetical protein
MVKCSSKRSLAANAANVMTPGGSPVLAAIVLAIPVLAPLDLTLESGVMRPCSTDSNSDSEVCVVVVAATAWPHTFPSGARMLKTSSSHHPCHPRAQTKLPPVTPKILETWHSKFAIPERK